MPGCLILDNKKLNQPIADHRFIFPIFIFIDSFGDKRSVPARTYIYSGRTYIYFGVGHVLVYRNRRSEHFKSPSLVQVSRIIRLYL